ncbi:MAG: endo-1,4-beta-xylanase [Deltaproteobacteria bacterium]|nr:endo-1,4-beta-xylanase [Deltaproteobacteria bacterium]
MSKIDVSSRAVLFVSICYTMIGCGSDVNIETQNDYETKHVDAATTALKLGEAAALSGRIFGSAIGDDYNSSGARKVLDRGEYNAATAEDAMKPCNIGGGLDRAILDYAKSHGMKNFRGHNLVWHTSQGDPGGGRSKMGNIRYAMERFKNDNFYAWDVVNEAFNDESGTFRGGYGNDYTNWGGVAQYFEEARKVANEFKKGGIEPPLLCYNDFNIEQYYTEKGSINDKSEAAYKMIKKINEDSVKAGKGKLIDCVGFQAHFNNYYTGYSQINASVLENMQRFAKLGIEIHLTELDVEKFNGEDDQAERFRKAIDFCTRVPECTGITVWGPMPEWRQEQDGGMFISGSLQPKKAYQLSLDQLNKAVRLVEGATAAYGGDGNVKISWKRQEKPKEYIVTRIAKKDDEVPDITEIIVENTNNGNTIETTDTCPSGAACEYQIAATNEDGTVRGRTVTAGMVTPVIVGTTIPAISNPPKAFTLSVTMGDVSTPVQMLGKTTCWPHMRLSWTKSGNATKYSIFGKYSEEDTFKLIAEVDANTTSYIDVVRDGSAIMPGMSFDYKVTAINGDGRIDSNTVSNQKVDACAGAKLVTLDSNGHYSTGKLPIGVTRIKIQGNVDSYRCTNLDASKDDDVYFYGGLWRHGCAKAPYKDSYGDLIDFECFFEALRYRMNDKGWVYPSDAGWSNGWYCLDIYNSGNDKDASVEFWQSECSDDEYTCSGSCSL